MHDIKDHNDILLSPVLDHLMVWVQEYGCLQRQVQGCSVCGRTITELVWNDFVDLSSVILSAPAGLGSNPSSTCCPEAAPSKRHVLRQTAKVIF